MRSSRTSRDSGFSLLEILVAFSVMSLSLGVLLRIFGGAGHVAGTADTYSRAIITAESLLASAGVETPLEPGEKQGQAGEDFRWRLNVHPYPVDEALLGSPAQGMGALRPYWVEMEVEWGPEDDPRAFTLTTLRLLQDKAP